MMESAGTLIHMSALAVARRRRCRATPPPTIEQTFWARPCHYASDLQSRQHDQSNVYISFAKFSNTSSTYVKKLIFGYRYFAGSYRRASSDALPSLSTNVIQIHCDFVHAGFYNFPCMPKSTNRPISVVASEQVTLIDKLNGSLEFTHARGGISRDECRPPAFNTFRQSTTLFIIVRGRCHSVHPEPPDGRDASESNPECRCFILPTCGRHTDDITVHKLI